MYGTVNELAARLLRVYPADEKLTLIIWAREDVRDFVADMALTEEEAGRILEDIDSLHETHESGVGEVTIRIMAENIREEARAKREVIVPALALENVCRLAAEFLRNAEVECGEGASQRLYENGPDSVAQIRRALEI